MRNWPSIDPAASEDFYIVVNHFGRYGTAFAEIDLDRANYETTISDLMSGHPDNTRPALHGSRCRCRRRRHGRTGRG